MKSTIISLCWLAAMPCFAAPPPEAKKCNDILRGLKGGRKSAKDFCETFVPESTVTVWTTQTTAVTTEHATPTITEYITSGGFACPTEAAQVAARAEGVQPHAEVHERAVLTARQRPEKSRPDLELIDRLRNLPLPHDWRHWKADRLTEACACFGLPLTTTTTSTAISTLYSEIPQATATDVVPAPYNNEPFYLRSSKNNVPYLASNNNRWNYAQYSPSPSIDPSYLLNGNLYTGSRRLFVHKSKYLAIWWEDAPNSDWVAADCSFPDPMSMELVCTRGGEAVVFEEGGEWEYKNGGYSYLWNAVYARTDGIDPGSAVTYTAFPEDCE
jgi:hypothetical protein